MRSHNDSIDTTHTPPPLSFYNTFNTVAGKLTTPEAGTQKVGKKIRISGRIRILYSQSDFRGKN